MLYREDDFELFSFDELKEPETELDYNPDFLIGKDKKVKRKYKQSNRKQKTPA